MVKSHKEKIFKIKGATQCVAKTEKVMINKKLILVSGLPRTGSTLMCQLLAQNPKIYSTTNSSPLYHAIESVRDALSKDPFFRSQMENDDILLHKRMYNLMQSMINGWFQETSKGVVVDKNRGWLGMVETLNLICPNFRMIVCLRDLTQIYASIEDKHAATRLFNFADDTPTNNVKDRYEVLFAKNGVIGSALQAIDNLNYIDNEKLKAKLCFVDLNKLITYPEQTMRAVHEKIGEEYHEIDFGNLKKFPKETDAFYNMKFPHTTKQALSRPIKRRKVNKLIREKIHADQKWFYSMFYEKNTQE